MRLERKENNRYLVSAINKIYIQFIHRNDNIVQLINNAMNDKHIVS